MGAIDALKARIEELGQAPLTTSRAIAMQIHRETPDLWGEWYEECAPALWVRFVGDVLRASRQQTAYQAEREAVAQAMTEAQKAGRRSLLDVVYVVSDDGNRKRLGFMGADDHVYVANERYGLGRKLAAEGDLHMMIAKKLRRAGKTTEEMFTEEQMRSLFRNYGRED